MTIVLNETEWARNMIEQRSMGKKPFETLSRIARFYLDKNYPKQDVRRFLESFVIQCDPVASIPKWSDTIEYALKRAMKYDAIKVDYIAITQPEMECIESLAGAQTKRLAFTLLCLAKYWNIVNPNGDNWVNTKDSDIMRMANISTSIKRQSQMFHELNAKGMIRFSKKVDNTNVRVCFIQDGEGVMQVSDFRNLGYQYLKYHGGPFFECQNCGAITRYNNPSHGGKQRYCKECAVEVAAQQRINSVMRSRNKLYDINPKC